VGVLWLGQWCVVQWTQSAGRWWALALCVLYGELSSRKHVLVIFTVNRGQMCLSIPREDGKQQGHSGDV
jgi:hypothetical protein